MKEPIILKETQNKLACHYSLTGNTDYDNGYNQAVKDLCKVIKDTIDKSDNQWYTKQILEQILKSY